MRKKRIEEFDDKCEWLKKGVIYHRGKHSEFVKENTIEAFDLSIKDSLGIEFDVRMTKDNMVVVSHDDNLKRVFGIDKKICESTYEDSSW